MTSLLAELRERWSRSAFARGVAIVAGGTALGQVVVLLVSPILTRLYAPDDFGYLALYASLLSLIVVVGSLRYHLAIPLPEADEDALSLVVVALAALVVVTALVAAGAIAAGARVLELFGAGALEPYVWLLPVGLAGAGTYQILSYWAIRKHAHRRLAATKLAQGAGLAVAQIVLGLMSWGPLGLICGDVLGRVAGSGTLARMTLRGGLWGGVTFPRIRSVLGRYRRFPLLSSPSALLNSGGLQVPSLLLLAFYGPQVAGWFALSQRVIGAPMTLLGTSVSQVYTGRAAELARAAPAELRQLFVKTASRLLLMAVAPALALVLAGPWLFSVVFGGSWVQAGWYTRILAPMFLLQFAVAPLSQTLNILERQDLQLAWDAARFALTVGALWLAHAGAWTDLQAVIAYAVAMASAYGALFVLSFLALRDRRPAHDA